MFQVTILVGYVAAGLSLLSSVGKSADSAKTRVTLAVTLTFVSLAVHAFTLWQVMSPASGNRISLGTTASLIGAVIAVAALFSARKISLRGLAAIMLPIAGILALGGIGGDSDVASADASYDRWYLYAHVILSVVAYGLLGVAAVLAVLTSLQDRRIRSGRPGGVAQLMPPLETMENTMFGAIGAGVGALSLAIFSGLIFVDDMLAQHLVHKTTLTLLAWLVFSTLLLGRWRFGWRGRKAISLTLWGFAVLLLGYFGSRLILEVVLGRQWG